jgi:Txe/YoeB family toxin of toxin-antitoxin system
VSYRVVFTKQAQKDAKKIGRSNLKAKASALIDILKENPFKTPPQYEALVGDLYGVYSRRINIQHRLVYQVIEEVKTVKVLRMWTHYGK